MNTTLLRIAAATIAALLLTATNPAEARAPKRTTIDVAAIPAYPTTAERSRYRAPRASNNKVRSSRAAYSSRADGGRSGGLVQVRSGKTGRTALVAAKYQSRFQGYIDDVESRGATIYYMGGWRGGRGSLASQHPWGFALDLCQDARGRVSGVKDCNLPRPAELAAIAKRHGLYEGALWCNSDYGHAQALPSARNCPYKGATGRWGDGRGRYLASITGAVQYAAAAKKYRKVRHHKIRYAARR